MTSFETDSEALPRNAMATASGCVALCVAITGSLGSVYLSTGLGLKACPLCFYQRSFMMAAAVSLLVSLWLDGTRSIRSFFVALPFASAGLGVAIFHECLVLSGTLECPAAIFGWGDGPTQSLVVFSVLTALCLFGAFLNRLSSKRVGLASILAVTLIGFAVAWACIASAPPIPPPPTQPYDGAKQLFDICRPPFIKTSN